MEKKTWVKPELIILLRSKPEEAVLWTCKDNVRLGLGSQNSGCYTIVDTPCDFQCSRPAGS
jgi:hypothetical protein